MPLYWKELSERTLVPNRWTIKNVSRRLAAADPWAGINRRPRPAARLGVHPERRLDRTCRRPIGTTAAPRKSAKAMAGTKRSAALPKRVMPSPEALGPRVAYLAIDEGTPVYDRSGMRVGVVEHVMDEGGIFEGFIVHTYPLPGRHLYADANQIDEIHQRGVVLSVERSDLHDPQTESAKRKWGQPETTLEARLRRALDWITPRL
jgi:hypothetical protein